MAGESQTVTHVEFDMEEIHELSMDLLLSLEQSGVSEGLAMLALALSLGRLHSPHRPMPEEEEKVYLQALMDWNGAFFADGGMN